MSLIDRMNVETDYNEGLILIRMTPPDSATQLNETITEINTESKESK